MTPNLITALENAGDAIDGWIAVLWTWLEPRLTALDSREEKLRSIRVKTAQDTAELPDLAAALVRLRSSGDVPRDAAACLAALERWVAESGRATTIFSGPVAGVDGEAYYVTSWQPWLAEAFWRHDERGRGESPDASYTPSMHTLAPRLVVVPAVVKNIAIEDIQPAGDLDASRSLRRARQRFEEVAAGQGAGDVGHPRFVIHLATLGPNPLDGFTPDRAREVFSYPDPGAGRPAYNEIEDSLVRAVAAAAADRATILLLPEFAVPVRCLEQLKALLGAADHAPVLTVAGLRHEDVVARGASTHDRDGALLSRWVNEAVVLGDDGSELFRHRKLTSYSLRDNDLVLQEDSRLGTCLPILRTAVGNIAVVTCLDAFSNTVDRLRASYASVVLVPSLSKSVSPHRVALAEVVRWLWGAAFVCNRHPTVSGSESWKSDQVRSFWTVALLNGCQRARELDGNLPTLVFELGVDGHEA